jgi:hypothetical protein
MWTVKDCFVGSQCWCGIIVDPNGEECNGYGEVSRYNCQYIVDALNKKTDSHQNVNAAHPIPWHVEEYPEHHRSIIVTTDGLEKDSLEHCIGSIYSKYTYLFVNAVNEFYK